MNPQASLLRLLKPFVPDSVWQRGRKWWQRREFDSALGRFSAVVERREFPDRQLLRDLIEAWGNTGWSAKEDYMEACLHEALSGERPILECGSGLTTILLGKLADIRNTEIWSLEHSVEWAERVHRILDRFDIKNVHVCIAPIRSYGDFDWYDPPRETMPTDFGLVVCDGPPADTRGGRFGLLPVMRDRLSPKCTILLDDGERTEEQEVAKQWAETLGIDVQEAGIEKPFLRLQLGA